MLRAALLPAATPFKFFVLAAGVFEVPLASFAWAIGLARIIRYFGVGYLAIKYGNDALPFLGRHKLAVAIFAVLFVAVGFFVSRGVLLGGPPSTKHCDLGVRGPPFDLGGVRPRVLVGQAMEPA